MFVKPEEAPLCTAELIKATTFTGTKEALREQFRDLRGAGFDHFSITIRHGHPEMLEEWIEVFAGI
jgi:hypothetical protein